jgi:hypothetical protein
VLSLPKEDGKPALFEKGHFPEPNIIGHMMSSMNKHEGKPVFTLDQIQSDWGQKLRDGGVRDAAPGHPLVNTTDQWTNTTLRRALRIAVEADADFIAIPHGDTVLSYNPGDEAGMQGFYGSRTSEGIVPKNLRKLLEKIDKDSAKPFKVTELETPSGMKGYGDSGGKFDKNNTGFTVFPITEKVKRSVVEEGQQMFALADRAPEPPIRQDMAVIDRLATLRDLVEACRG